MSVLLYFSVGLIKSICNNRKRFSRKTTCERKMYKKHDNDRTESNIFLVTFRRVKKPSINVTPLSGGEKGTESTAIKVIDHARVPLIRDGKKDRLIGGDYRITAWRDKRTLMRS